MNCKRCENEFQSNFVYCPYCGLKLTSPLEEANDKESIEQIQKMTYPSPIITKKYAEEIEYDYENEFLEKKKSKKPLAIMFMVFAVICALISASCFYLGYVKGNAEKKQATKDIVTITAEATTKTEPETTTASSTATETQSSPS